MSFVSRKFDRVEYASEVTCEVISVSGEGTVEDMEAFGRDLSRGNSRLM